MEDLGFAWEPMAIAVIMMALDMVFGFAGAAKNKKIQSEKMREGLWHKAGFFGIIILAWVYEFAAQYMNFEAHQANIGIAMPEIPAVTAVCCFIVATEIISIIENLCELNEKIEKLPFISALVPHKPDEPDIKVEVVEKKEDEEIKDKREGTD